MCDGIKVAALLSPTVLPTALPRSSHIWEQIHSPILNQTFLLTSQQFCNHATSKCRSNFICTYSHWTSTKYANVLFVSTFKFRFYSLFLLYLSELQPLSAALSVQLISLPLELLFLNIISSMYSIDCRHIYCLKYLVAVVPPSSLINHKDHPNALWR